MSMCLCTVVLASVFYSFTLKVLIVNIRVELRQSVGSLLIFSFGGLGLLLGLVVPYLCHYYCVNKRLFDSFAALL